MNRSESSTGSSDSKATSLGSENQDLIGIALSERTNRSMSEQFVGMYQKIIALTGKGSVSSGRIVQDKNGGKIIGNG